MGIKNSYEQTLERYPPFLAKIILRTVNWLFQATLFASRAEQIAKISMDIILTLIFTYILLQF